jgi:hypothetical protein
LLLKDTNDSSVHLKMVTNYDFNSQAIVDDARKLTQRLNVVIASFREHVLDENGIGYWKQALWNKLFFSEIPEATVFDFLEIAPIDISPVRKFGLCRLIPFLKCHVCNERHGFPFATQLGKLLHFILATQESIIIDWWQIFLELNHFFP